MAKKKGAGGKPQEYNKENGRYGATDLSEYKYPQYLIRMTAHEGRPKESGAISGAVDIDDIQDTILLPDEQLGHSLSAKWANYEIELSNGEKVKFLEGSKLHHKEVFAGKGTKTPIREVEGLVKNYGGKAENWQKIKAFGTIVHRNGKTEEVEIHWYEEPSVGKVKLKEKVR